ncbi:hypothetical protein NEOLEDRAFT_92496 [Neolentinus lepideus HHB14362 ss-1]|uniref:Uncharacterized protein n=1 Tax=Neolentinus lepideus HHB14362 ss-1 TaxID=1314782 RepID=A0A165U208_9AGAM|nr:hypothetical protein NEOLEDRAFT_92496 [Neolentinus lepideus HHB14362 ss-1]
MSSGAMMSNVGNPQIYEDGDQRTSKGTTDAPASFEAGQRNAHDQLDSKDERTLGNKLAQAEKVAHDEKQRAKTKPDPTGAARSHGNEPSRGAQIDAELQAEDEATFKQKGKGSFGPNV